LHRLVWTDWNLVFFLQQHKMRAIVLIALLLCACFTLFSITVEATNSGDDEQHIFQSSLANLLELEENKPSASISIKAPSVQLNFNNNKPAASLKIAAKPALKALEKAQIFAGKKHHHHHHKHHHHHQKNEKKAVIKPPTPARQVKELRREVKLLAAKKQAKKVELKKSRKERKESRKESSKESRKERRKETPW